MNSLPDFFGNINRRIFIGIGLFAGLLIAIVLFWHLRSPVITEHNLGEGSKLASNAPLSFQFNHFMDRGSVESGFSLSPPLSGRFEWSFRQMTFIPEERFKVGESYEVVFASTLQNILGRSLPEPAPFRFTVTDPPQVVLALPQNEALPDAKLTVMFDRPIVELTTYDTVETRTIPLTLEPPVEGRFKWLGTSALQFIPKERFAYSTQYQVLIPAGLKALDGGTLEADYKFSFSTPRLAILEGTPDAPSANQPLFLRFNQPVDLNSLEKHLTVKKGDQAIPTETIPFKLTYFKTTEALYDEEGRKTGEKEMIDQTFIEVFPLTGDWGYENHYLLEVSPGVMGLEGNLATTTELTKAFTTQRFLMGYSPEGKDADPQGDLVLHFDQPVDLALVRQNISVEPAVDFRVNYGQKCDPQWEPQESPDEECAKIRDDTTVIFSPKTPLANRQEYRVTFATGMHAEDSTPYLKAPVTWAFTVADELKILGPEALKGSYSQWCLYATTQLDPNELEQQFVFSPPISQSVSVTSYPLRVDQNWSFCKFKDPARPYAVEMNTLLDPDTPYTIVIKAGTKDIFAQTLKEDYRFTYRTEPLRDRDTSLALAQENVYAVSTLDQHAAPVFVTRNLKEFTLELCRLSAAQFLEIDSDYARRYKPDEPYQRSLYGWDAFEPSATNCSEYRTVQKAVPLKYWQRQFTEVDLTKDLGHSPSPGYYFLRASSPHVFSAYKPDGTGENPFKPYQILSLTNLHVAMKQSDDDALFWVTDITKGQPIKDAQLDFYTSKGEVVPGTGKSDASGLFKMVLDGNELTYVMASLRGDQVILSSSWSDGISPWDFNLNYSPATRYHRGYVYTDRPLYRPTHEVFFKGIVREDFDAELRLPKETKVAVTIMDSAGTNIYQKELTLTRQGTFHDSLKLDAAAPLGQYQIEACIKSDQAQLHCTAPFYQSFFVEEYKKPEYKLTAAFDQADYFDHQTLTLNLQGNYFFGPPVKKGQVDWSLVSQNYYFDEYDEEWFSFTDYETFNRCYFGCPFEDAFIASGQGQLSQDGQMTIRHPIDLTERDAEGKVKPPDASKIYTLYATVQDQNNQTVSTAQSVIVHRGEYYVGVKNESYMVSVGEEMPIKVITVDPKGVPLSGKSVQLELSLLEWKSVKKRQVDGEFYWTNELQPKKIKSTRVTTDGSGLAQHRFTIPQGGEYRVKATGKDSLGNVFSSTVNFYATSDEVVHWREENHNRMALKLDRAEYEVGDTARVLVESPYRNVKALFTLERGTIMESKVIDITSNTPLIEIPITEKMLPNFFVSVLLIKGGNKADPPDFKVGYASVVVDTAPKTLQVKLATNKPKYHPRETVTLTITTIDRDGKPVPADVSVAVVDQSLLALKGNPVRQLAEHFFNRRSLGVRTTDTFTKLLKRVDLTSQNGDKGGGGGEADTQKPRGEFEDTAYWRSSLTTDQNGQLTTQFTLPDNLTTWNIEAISSTANSLFGDANTTIITQKDLIVRPVLPRFVLFKDELHLGAIVHNYLDRKASFVVDLSAENLTITDAPQKKVTLMPGDSTKLIWQTMVPTVQAGTMASVTFTAKGGGAEDSVVYRFPIRSYSTPETVALSSFTDDTSFTEKILLPESIDPTLGELKITTGATLATYFADSLNYLIGFPYGCVEQIMSRLVPMVILKNSASLKGLENKFQLQPIVDEQGRSVPFDTMLSQTLQRLYRYQRSDGGWGYFEGSNESYPTLTAYAVFGLRQIQRGGHPIDIGVLNRASDYLRNYMVTNTDLKDSYTGKLGEKTTRWADNRAYLLHVLAEIDQGDAGLTNNLFEDRALLSNGGRAYLAMALDTLAGSERKVKTLIQALENEARIETRGTYIRNNSTDFWAMMTHTKVTALTLQLFNRVQPDHPLIPKLISWLIKMRKDGHWQTTQENVAALLSLMEFLERSKEAEANYSAKIKLDGSVLKEYTVNRDTLLDSQETQRAIADLILGDDGNDLIFVKDGTGRLYYDVVLRYFLPVDEILPRSEGFEIRRDYYPIDDEKMENPITSAKAGETLRGHLTILVPEERGLVAVENFLPAGFELVNFEFSTADQRLKMDQNSDEECYDCGKGGYSYEGPWSHKELRDDRLFLFADRLPQGLYEYDYYVNVTSEGKFHHPPAVVSEMYFPENFGRTQGGWLEVRE